MGANTADRGRSLAAVDMLVRFVGWSWADHATGGTAVQGRNPSKVAGIKEREGSLSATAKTVFQKSDILPTSRSPRERGGSE